MADLLLLSEAQMRRIEPYFPLSHGIARVDDRRVISGIIYVIRYGFSGKMRRPAMDSTRRFIIGLSTGAGSACSPASLPLWPAKAACPSA